MVLRAAESFLYGITCEESLIFWYGKQKYVQFAGDYYIAEKKYIRGSPQPPLYTGLQPRASGSLICWPTVKSICGCCIRCVSGKYQVIIR